MIRLLREAEAFKWFEQHGKSDSALKPEIITALTDRIIERLKPIEDDLECCNYLGITGQHDTKLEDLRWLVAGKSVRNADGSHSKKRNRPVLAREYQF